MIMIKVRDNRNYKGFRLKFFDTLEVTEEVYDFVEKFENAYLIHVSSEFLTREKFLFQYREKIKKEKEN